VSRRGIEILLVIALAMPCLASDREFKSVVSAIEAEYNTKHMRIPMLKLATFGLHVAGTPAPSDMKLAVFEHLDLPLDASTGEIERKINSAMGGGWHPLVRVKARDEGQFTLIYANTDEKKMKVMVIVLQPENATVVEVTLKESDVKKWIKDPKSLGEGSSRDRDTDGE
jgi:hypothetical protein